MSTVSVGWESIEKGRNYMRGVAGGVVAFLLIAFGLSIAFGSWYTVGQDERAVLTRWGAIVDDNIAPGLHGKMPWVNGVTQITIATQRTVYDQMEAYSRDQQPAHFRISVNWHIPADKIGEVYWRYGGGADGLVDRLLDRHVPQQSKNVFGRYNAITLIQERNAFNQDVFKALSDSVNGQPIIIESVQVEDVQFSQDYIAAVKARMIAEVEVQKLRQQEEQQKVNAEITVINATAAANAVRQDANGKADARLAQATAEAKAIELQGKSIADAMALKGKALAENPKLVDMAIAEKWSGALPTQMIPGGTIPFINVSPQQQSEPQPPIVHP